MAAAPPLYSTVLGNNALWDEPNPDYTTLTAIVGGAAATNQNDARQAILDCSA